MNTANTVGGNADAHVEQSRQSVDLKSKLREFIGELSYGERKLFEEAVWQDPDNEWKETDQKWEVGFLEYMRKKVLKSDGFSKSVFEDYIRKLEKHHEKISYTQEPENKKFFKAQVEIAKKIMGLYVSEDGETQKKKNENERMKSIYSWENIKFTVRNIRRQIIELFGTKDPWWNYTQEQKGMSQLEKQAVGQSSESHAAAKPEPRGEPTIYDQFLQKKSANNNGSPARKSSGGGESSQEDLAA